MSHKNNRTKRSRQGRDKGNPNRPRSKNNPKGRILRWTGQSITSAAARRE